MDSPCPGVFRNTGKSFPTRTIIYTKYSTLTSINLIRISTSNMYLVSLNFKLQKEAVPLMSQKRTKTCLIICSHFIEKTDAIIIHPEIDL